MVLVTDISEKPSKQQRTTGAVLEEDDGFVTDSGSEASDSDDGEVIADLDDDDLALDFYDPSNETLRERLYALKDMISPRTRSSLSSASSAAQSYGFAAWRLGGQLAWVVITSAVVLGLPLALAIEGETVIAAQERFEREQQSGQQMMTAGQTPQGIVPPGF